MKKNKSKIFQIILLIKLKLFNNNNKKNQMKTIMYIKMMKLNLKLKNMIINKKVNKLNLRQKNTSIISLYYKKN